MELGVPRTSKWNGCKESPRNRQSILDASFKNNNNKKKTFRKPIIQLIAVGANE